MNIKNIFLYLTLVLVAGLSFAGCQGEKPIPEIRLHSDTVEVPVDGGVMTLEYKLINGDDALTLGISNTQDWISGINCDVPGRIMFNVAANKTGEVREATLGVLYEGLLNPVSFTVRQAGAYPEIVLKQTRVDIPGTGGSGKVNYEISNPLKDKDIELTCKEDWVKNLMASKGEISFAVAGNPLDDGRQAEVTVSYEGAKDVAFVIYQLAESYNVTVEANGVKFDMVFVEGGTFKMGATTEEEGPYTNEYPVHDVTLSDYYIGKYEVTQELWEAVMDENPSYNQADPQNPLEYISWETAQIFVQKLSELTGRTFELPTEAQWEYAARGGKRSQHYVYSGSNNLDEVGWYTANTTDGTRPSSQPVGSKSPNELGIYDMSGNVWEWCRDSKMPYTEEPQTDPVSEFDGVCCVLRGGSYYTEGWYCRVSLRYDYPIVERFNDFGLRLVMIP